MKKISLSLFLLFALLPAAALGDFSPGDVAMVSTHSGRLNLRSAGNSQATVLTRLSSGTQVVVLQKQGAWYRVESKEYTGYVHGDYLRSPAQADGSPIPADAGCFVQGTVGYVSTRQGCLHLRNGASLSGAVIAKLPNGFPVILLSQQGQWMRVKTSVGTGYVHASYLSYSPPDSSPHFFFIYAQPDADSPVIDIAASQDTLHLLDSGPSWSRVLTRDGGAVGYIKTNLLSLK